MKVRRSRSESLALAEVLSDFFQEHGFAARGSPGCVTVWCSPTPDGEPNHVWLHAAGVNQLEDGVSVSGPNREILAQLLQRKLAYIR